MAVIKNVEISWVKCDQENPDMGFDGESPRWSVTIDKPPKSVLDLWKSKGFGGLKKHKDSGEEYIEISRKANPFENGDPKEAPIVVDGHLKALDPNIVGNGSTANIQYSSYEWKFKTRSGVSADLMGIQVTNLVRREGATMEFELIDDEVHDAAEPTADDQESDDPY